MVRSAGVSLSIATTGKRVTVDHCSRTIRTRARRHATRSCAAVTSGRRRGRARTLTSIRRLRVRVAEFARSKSSAPTRLLVGADGKRIAFPRTDARAFDPSAATRSSEKPRFRQVPRAARPTCRRPRPRRREGGEPTGDVGSGSHVRAARLFDRSAHALVSTGSDEAVARLDDTVARPASERDPAWINASGRTAGSRMAPASSG